MQDQGYNGYPNYETWATSLWIANEESFYNDVRQIAADCVAAYGEDAAYRVAGELREYVEQTVIGEMPAGLASDLINAAMSDVDWDHLADNAVSEANDDRS